MVCPRLDIVNRTGGLLEWTQFLDGELGRLEEYSPLDDVFLVEGCRYLLLPVDLDLGVERGGPGLTVGDGVRGRVYYLSYQYYLSMGDRDMTHSLAHCLALWHTSCSSSSPPAPQPQ